MGTLKEGGSMGRDLWAVVVGVASMAVTAAAAAQPNIIWLQSGPRMCWLCRGVERGVMVAGAMYM
jgi:hypothetical protein